MFFKSYSVSTKEQRTAVADLISVVQEFADNLNIKKKVAEKKTIQKKV